MQHSIIVFGGAGRTGSEVVLQALEAGHSVSAFVYRTPQKGILPEHPKLRIIEGDARDAAQVRSALASHDVVINIIAPKFGDKKNYDISVVATKNIVDGMLELGITRYIGQAGAWGTEFTEDASILMQIGFKVLRPLRQIYAYKKTEDRIVKNSDLAWTLVRAGVLTNGKRNPNIRVMMTRHHCKLFEIPTISRKSVAAFHLSIIDNPQFVRTTPIIVS